MRKTILLSPILAAALLALAPLSAAAGGGKGCPPGLAKKQNGCLPPGQAQKVYGRGDVIGGDYIVIGNPGRYGLDPNQSYYRVGDYIYRVDPDTRKVLNLIGAVAAILN